jgi:hypothetical protein
VIKFDPKEFPYTTNCSLAWWAGNIFPDNQATESQPITVAELSANSRMKAAKECSNKLITKLQKCYLPHCRWGILRHLCLLRKVLFDLTGVRFFPFGYAKAWKVIIPRISYIKLKKGILCLATVQVYIQDKTENGEKPQSTYCYSVDSAHSAGCFSWICFFR